MAATISPMRCAGTAISLASRSLLKPSGFKSPARLQKYALSASAIAGSIGGALPTRLAKYSSFSRIEFVAMSSSRLRPLSWSPGADAKETASRCARMAFSRLTAPL